MNAAGQLPTCTSKGPNGPWTVSYPSGSTSFGNPGGGVPSGFIALIVIAILIGVGITIWRVSLARSLATRAGMDPNQATAITLLGDPGLDATYLAASFRQSQLTQPVPAPMPSRPNAETRLRELQQLRDNGLVNDDEYNSRRTAIVDSI